MKLTIDEKVCARHKMSIEEFILALMFRQIRDPIKVRENLLKREILVKVNGKYLVTQRWSEEMDEILTDSIGDMGKSVDELAELAVKVKDCFPQCKMKDRYGRDTPYYYRCNKSEVAKALKRFFVQYGNNYTDEEIVDATKRYVASFKGNYSGMRLAKYFIMKNPVKQGEDGNGYVEQVSDLLTFLENKEEGDGVGGVNNDDWTLKVI